MMSSVAHPAGPASLSVRATQMRAVVLLEARRALLTRRVFVVVVLAFLPVLMILARVAVSIVFPHQSPLEHVQNEYAAFFAIAVQRFGLYFGCVALFSGAFRREIEDRSLHYYFLCPVRREVVAGGKFVSSFLIAASLFSCTTILSYLLILAPHGLTAMFSVLFDQSGLLHLGSYLLVIVAGSMAYGSIFFALGSILRNPIFPAVAYFFFESIGHVLPGTIRAASVAHYLSSLLPFRGAEDRVFQVPVEAPHAGVALAVLVALAILGVTIGAWRVRRLELAYGSD